MKDNTRRTFIKGTAAAGVALGAPLAAFAANEAALADVHRPVARVLASYGAARNVEMKGNVTRITIDAHGVQPLARSFERFTNLSDHVRVENDNATFDYGKTTYIVENRLSV